MSINAPVLVLNQNYQPLNVCNARRALVLLDMGRAELMEHGRGYIHSISKSFSVPSVIRLYHMVKRPLVQRRLSRRAVFYRDGFCCQYCGVETKLLTVDHVLPRSRGGEHVWENVVSACISCNHRKAGATPREANMKLLHEPRTPRPNPYYLFHHRTILDEWRQFIPWLG
jgi:5-methylcytosine-specific restriction endonuclease McrA